MYEMKKLFYIIMMQLFCQIVAVRAQSLTTAMDTVYVTAVNDTDVTNSFGVLGGASIGVDWRVLSSDFPMDWQVATGLCDANNCFSFNTLWPVLSVQHVAALPGSNSFRFVSLLSTVTPGCHYATIKFNKTGTASDSVLQTYMVCRPSGVGVLDVAQKGMSMVHYPNPVSNELHINCNTTTAKGGNIRVLDVAGRVLLDRYEPAISGATISVDVHTLVQGTYMLEVVTDGMRQVATFEIMR
jgi:hypothetical protein